MHACWENSQMGQEWSPAESTKCSRLRCNGRKGGNAKYWQPAAFLPVTLKKIDGVYACAYFVLYSTGRSLVHFTAKRMKGCLNMQAHSCSHMPANKCTSKTTKNNYYMEIKKSITLQMNLVVVNHTSFKYKLQPLLKGLYFCTLIIILSFEIWNSCRCIYCSSCCYVRHSKCSTF